MVFLLHAFNAEFLAPGLVYQVLGHLFCVPEFKTGRKRKINALHKNKKVSSVTYSSKLNIEPEHINTVNRTNNYHSTQFLSFCQCIGKKLGTSCPELSTKQLDLLEQKKMLSAGAKQGGTLG